MISMTKFLVIKCLADVMSCLSKITSRINPRFVPCQAYIEWFQIKFHSFLLACCR